MQGLLEASGVHGLLKAKIEFSWLAELCDLKVVPCWPYCKSLEIWRIGQWLEEKQGLPGGTVVKNPPANAGDTGSSPGPGRSHMPRSN